MRLEGEGVEGKIRIRVREGCRMKDGEDKMGLLKIWMINGLNLLN